VVGIARFHAAAGKADLPGVVREVRAPLGQEHMQAFGAIDERYQDCSGRRRAVPAGQAKAVAHAACARRRWAGQSLYQPGALRIRREIEQGKGHDVRRAARRRAAPHDTAGNVPLWQADAGS